MRKILGVNISHNCSFAYFEDKILKEYYEEDRFNKVKKYTPQEEEHGNFDYEYQILKKFKDITFDVIVFASYDRGHLQIELAIIKHILKQVKHKKFYFDIKNHHIYHASCGYLFGNFKDAIALVSDGGGEMNLKEGFRALQSIFLINEKEIEKKFQHYSIQEKDYFNNFVPIQTEFIEDKVDYVYSNKAIGGRKYYNYLNLEKVWNYNIKEEGQLMGIAAYKDKETDLDKDVLEIANKAQEETLEDFVVLMERAKKYSDCKNIILSGGYHMNCSNNFKIVKKYPEYNFFVDPVAYDGGTAIGAAYYYENYL